MRSLAEIVNHYGAEKPAMYLPHYERNMGHLRGNINSLLEIGIFEGNSLRAWHEYFGCPVDGIDIKIPTGDFPDEITMIECDQSNRDEMKRKLSGPYDIIIDDGSHFPAHFWTAYQTLWPIVTPGGWYVIEDLQAARHPDIGWGSSQVSNMQNRVYQILLPMINQDEKSDIDWIEVHDHIIFLRKKNA